MLTGLDRSGLIVRLLVLFRAKGGGTRNHGPSPDAP